MGDYDRASCLEMPRIAQELIKMQMGEQELRYRSVGELLPSWYKALDLIPSTIKRREHEMAWQVKALVTKYYNLSSNPRTLI